MTDDRQDRVRRRAYELWEQQGSEHGRHEDHWHRASAEIDGGEQVDTVQAAVTAPDGTTLTGPDETVDDAPAAAKPTRKRAAPKPAASAPSDKATPKPRKPKAK